jgi:hypothetical protein
MAARLFTLIAAIALGAGAARADLHPLDVPAKSGWQHAQTGLTLMSHLGGLTRRSIGDFGNEEADLALAYDDGDAAKPGTTASLFLFHPGIASVPIWFDRAQTAIMAGRAFSGLSASSPIAFAAKPGGPADGLRVTYGVQNGTVTSTALAAIPVGQWLLVVRMTSSALDPAALDAKLSALLHDIRWPADQAAGPAAVPIAACTKLRVFKKAKVLPPDMTQMLFNAVLPDAVAKEDKTPVTYCRAAEGPNAAWAVYQAEGADDGYVLALGDGGRAIGVAPALVLKGRPAYAVTMFDLTRRLNFPNVSALLPPEQAIDLANGTAPLSATSTLGGKTDITINSNAVGSK